MAAVSTWVKVVLVVVALGMLGMCAVAGAGVYFVSRHVQTSSIQAPEALREFEDARGRLGTQQPLIEIDSTERPVLTRAIADVPTAASPATVLVVKAWNPSDERIVNFRVPLWVLSVGERKVDLGVGAGSFDLRRMHIDVDDLRRIGPMLLLDLKSPSGERALIWTE